MTHPATSHPPMAVAAIVLPGEGAIHQWIDDHCARLAFILTRAELAAARRAQRAVPTFERPVHFLSWSRAALARTVGWRDAYLLMYPHHQPWAPAHRRAAAERVALVGTPTWWTGQHVDATTACPLRPPTSPAHRWSETNPVCAYCATAMGDLDPVDREAVAEQVWQHGAGLRSIPTRRKR